MPIDVMTSGVAGQPAVGGRLYVLSASEFPARNHKRVAVPFGSGQLPYDQYFTRLTNRLDDREYYDA
jgi:hypothetical protein